MDDRVLVWAAGRDGPLTCDILADAGFGCRVCGGVEELCAEADAGAGAVIAAAELLTPDVAGYLEEFLGRQPPWSDLPVVVVAGGGDPAGAGRHPFAGLGNVAVLSRPVALDTLVSTVRSALRARRRQYEVRDLLRQQDEAGRRKDEFLAMLAHELRNPLAPVRSAVEVLRLKATGDPVLANVRDIIARQVGHMARLVDDLLDVSRITRGKIALRKEVVDLGDTLAQVTRGMTQAAADRGLDLSLAAPADPVLVDADPTRLEQMVGNALGNALKFTPAGGRVRVSAAREGRQAVVRVRDTGVGIPPAMLKQVFELFAQTDRPLDRGQGGLGIGLTVLRGLAELHGGAAEIHSDGEGTGTEVVIRLPARPAAEAPAGCDARPAGASAVAPLRILVVDDNVDAAESLAMLLSAYGHTVVAVHDGHAALRAARETPPQVAVLDIGLPGMSGYELVKRLRAEAGACRYIAVTGYGEEKDRRRALEAGFDLHLTKPVDPELLLRAMAG